MINKNIEDITESDLQALIDNKVLEGKTIEYKKELTGTTDSNKKEFLADVTSFANAGGGDLIFGIEEDSNTREPKSLTGLAVDSIDSEKGRLDNIVRTGVEPRIINITMKAIPLSNSRYALLIRVPRSWTSPHRVVLGGHAKFYTRSSSGKYEMDVDELRFAFNLSETLIDRIRNFRMDRIAKITANETPVPLDSQHRIVLHLISGNAFNPSVKYEINNIYDRKHEKLPLLYRTVMNGRYNLDGLFTYSNVDRGQYSAYTQLFRNGIIEAVDSRIMIPSHTTNGMEYPNLIPANQFESYLLQSIAKYLKLMSELVIEPPIFIFLSMLNVKDFVIYTNRAFDHYTEAIDRDMLFLPGEIIESFDTVPEKIMKPIFDLIWNSCGEPKSLNFDENDNWRESR